MATSFKRYIDITSGVGAGAVVPRREFIARLFTSNDLLPPNSYIEFTSAADVATYFGILSEEYLRSVFYFSWISKNITRPKKIAFARWVSANSAAMIFGKVKTQTLASYTAITAGSFGLTLGAVAKTFTGIDFSAAASLSDVASIVQTEIRTSVTTTNTCALTSADAVITMSSTAGLSANMIATGNGIPAGTTIVSVDDGTTITLSQAATITGSSSVTFYTSANTIWALSTVQFDATRGCFNFVAGSAIAAVLSVTVGASNDIAVLLGWLPQQAMVNGAYIAGAIWNDGTLAETPVAAVIASATASNNFGSFTFMQTLTIDEIEAVAEWNNTQNVMFMYLEGVTLANATDWATTLLPIGGNALTRSDLDVEYPEMIPMLIFAATNYDAVNSVQNYEFQQFDVTPSVTTDADADAMDLLRINYYGQTQQAGQLISFYQQGVMNGLATDPVDMNTYANEVWLKDAAGVALMTLFLSVAKVSANAQGRAQLLATIQPVINQALDNGTISVGKTLSTVQQLYIAEITNDPNAWYQVQNIGYWVDFVITQNSSTLKYEATYTLVYSKDDVIRKVNGTHVLI